MFNTMYVITSYTRRRARELGVQVRVSNKKGKKIDVYKDGAFVVSIGSLGMGDYPSYLKSHGASLARARQRSYLARSRAHTRPGSAGYYARKLLW